MQMQKTKFLKVTATSTKASLTIVKLPAKVFPNPSDAE